MTTKPLYHYSATIWEHMESESGRVYAPHVDQLLQHLTQKDWKHTITTVYFQLEEGQGGLRHWQMHFVLSAPITGTLKTWLRSLFDIDEDKPKQCVWIKKAMYPRSSINYAQKVKSRIEGPYRWDRTNPGNHVFTPAGRTIAALLNATPTYEIP